MATNVSIDPPKQFDVAKLREGLPRPADGTKLRAVFDQLLAHVGNPVKLKSMNAQIAQLEHKYRLRITRRRDGRYILRGYLSGSHYTDLVTGKLYDLDDPALGRIFRDFHR